MFGPMWVDVRDPLITLNAEREHRLSQESALMARMINARFKTRRESFLVRLPEQHCQNAVIFPIHYFVPLFSILVV